MSSTKSIKVKASYNESCSLDYDCEDGLWCSFGDLFKCNYGYIWSEQYKKYLDYDVGSCNESIQCQDYDKNRVCTNGKCKCDVRYS